MKTLAGAHGELVVHEDLGVREDLGVCEDLAVHKDLTLGLIREGNDKNNVM